FTLDRLVPLASLLGMTVGEIAAQAEQAPPRIRTPTQTQERGLTPEPGLPLVAAWVRNGWAPAEVTGPHKFRQGEWLERLLKLDRLGLIALLPGDRVRLNVARDFDWLPHGPIERFFRKQEKDDFLDDDFTGDGESFYFVFGMLTPDAKARLAAQLGKVR